MIVAKNLSKSFGDILAVDNVNFCLKKGEVVSLLGPNGAGKTTLLRLLTGYLAPEKGIVSINGFKMEQERLKALENIGYVPENSPLYPEMSVFELLQYSAFLHQLSKDSFKKNLEQVVDDLQLQTVLNQKFSTLSKGFKHRTGIACSLIFKPKVLILDEPTEGLDPNQKFDLRRLIKDYGQKNIVLVSTHIMEEVAAISTRVLLLNHGKLIRDTSAEELEKLAPDGNLETAFRTITADL